MIFPIDPIERTSGTHNPPFSGDGSPEKPDKDDNKDDKEDDRDTIEISEEGLEAAKEYQENQTPDEE